MEQFFADVEAVLAAPFAIKADIDHQDIGLNF